MSAGPSLGLRRAVFILGVVIALLALSTGARADTPVALENRLAGTSAWALDRPATEREIEGYASATSVDRGDAITLHVSTAAPSFAVEVFRTGWYQGLGARRVAGPLVVTGQAQPAPSPDPATGLVDAGWDPSLTLQTRDPASEEPWSTGVYLARLTESAGGKQSYVIFVVRDDAHRPDVLFQLPVTTYQAYNFWGGKSLYRSQSGAATPWGSTSGWPATKVSFDRPYVASTNPAAANGIGSGEFLTNVQAVAEGYPISSAGWDYNMVRWLERHEYDVGYVTNLDTGRRPGLVQNTNVFLSQGHDEYWTWEMRANVEAARDAGVNLAFFSANTSYWQVRLEASPVTQVADRVMVSYKYNAEDPFASDADPTNDRYVTVRFRDAPVSWPEAGMKGSQYGLDPFDGDIIVSNASHWVFSGTGLANGQHLPGLLGYEVDGVEFASPPNTVTLSDTPVYSIPSGSPSGTSQMTIYTAGSGAGVFGTGSIQWSWGLDDFGAPALRTSRLSAEAATITVNVLRGFGAEPGVLPLGLALGAPLDGAENLRATPSFTWDATTDASTSVDRYELWIDGTRKRELPASACTAGSCSITLEQPLADGPHTWLARAVDDAGDAWSTATRSFTVDATPPPGFALLAPAGGAATASGTPTLSWEPTTDAGAGLDHYEVTIDGATHGGLLPPTTTDYTPAGPLRDGEHRWHVTAVDANGATTTTTTRTFTTDTTPPQTTLRGGPAGTTVATTARFEFSSSEPSSTFRCRLDDAAWEPCSNPASLAGLDHGEHTFRVRSVDTVGNSDPTPDERTWSVDARTPPTARLDVTPNPARVGGRVTLDATRSTDHADGAIASYAWDLDGDGSFETSTGASGTTSATYPRPGRYAPAVRVTSTSGRSSERSEAVEVLAPAAAAAPAPAPRTSGVAQPRAATTVRELAGTIAFSEYSEEDRRWYLVVREPGSPQRRLPVEPSAVSFDADIGTDAKGRPEVIYRRCAGTLTAPTGCRLFVVSPTGLSGERAVRNADDPRYNDVTPTLWAGRIAWTREYGSAEDPRPVVYTRLLTAPRSRPSTRLYKVPRRRCAPPGTAERRRCGRATERRVRALELRGDRLGLIVSYSLDGATQSEVRLDDLRTGSRRTVALHRAQSPALLPVGPSFAHGRLTWYSACADSEQGACRSGVGPWRYRLSTGRYEHAGPVRSPVSGFADAGTRFFAVVGCGAPESPAADGPSTDCRVESVRATGFRPIAPPKG